MSQEQPEPSDDAPAPRTTPSHVVIVGPDGQPVAVPAAALQQVQGAAPTRSRRPT